MTQPLRQPCGATATRRAWSKNAEGVASQCPSPGGSSIHGRTGRASASVDRMIERARVVLALLAACGGTQSTAPTKTAYDPEPVVIAGAFPTDRGPDGNSIILRAPRGLIVVDTGRHTQHQDKLLELA